MNIELVVGAQVSTSPLAGEVGAKRRERGSRGLRRGLHVAKIVVFEAPSPQPLSREGRGAEAEARA
jgi:hypothetical protein